MADSSRQDWSLHSNFIYCMFLTAIFMTVIKPSDKYKPNKVNDDECFPSLGIL